MSKFLVKSNEEKRQITAPILVPDVVDLHGDTYNVEETELACRSFNKCCKKSNLQHAVQLSNDAAEWLESYITIGTTILKGVDGDDIEIKPGTWMGTMHVKHDELWEEVKKGTFTGFSIGCKANVVDIAKAKIAGDTQTEAKKRLSDFDFSGVDCHVALVDSAANATEFLVMKALEADSQGATLNMKPKSKDKEVNMDALEQANKEIADLKKSLEVKATQDTVIADLQKSLDESNEALENDKKELEVLKAAALEAEKLKFVAKAKDIGAEDADSMGEALRAIKCLSEDVYTQVITHMEKNENIIKNKEFLKDSGESSDGKDIKSTDDILKSIEDTLKSEDDTLKGADLKQKAIDMFKTQHPEEYAKQISGK